MASIFLMIGLCAVIFMLSLCVGGNTSKSVSPSNTASTDCKLEETCKDWLFSRNRAYKLGREGNIKGSEQAHRAMALYMQDLQRDFSEKQISETIDRLEKCGYRTGF